MSIELDFNNYFEECIASKYKVWSPVNSNYILTLFRHTGSILQEYI